MKTLVLYSSKTGNTKTAAKYIAKHIKGASLVNFAEKQPNIKNYDLIIVGSGVYFGKINNKLKKYLKENIDDLLEKKFALFFCCDKTTDKKIKYLIDKNFKGRLQDNAIDIVCASKNVETSNSYYYNKMSYWFGRQENKTASEIEQSIDYDILDDFIELLSNITIVEKDRQLRNNPVPPIKDVKTRKERVKNINKPKQKHKQVVDQKQQPQNKKMKPTKAAKSAGIDNTKTETTTTSNTKTKNTSTKNTNTTNKPTTNKTTSTANKNASLKTAKTSTTKTKNGEKAASGKQETKANNKTTTNNKTNANNKTIATKSKAAATSKATTTKKPTAISKTKSTNSSSSKTTNAKTKNKAESPNNASQPSELPNKSKDAKNQTTNSNSNTTVSKTKPLE